METFDNFAAFIAYFDEQVSRRVYQQLVTVTLGFEVASRLDPVYSVKRDLVFLALPFLPEAQVPSAHQPLFAQQLRCVLKGQPLNEHPLEEVSAVQAQLEASESHAFVTELPHYIKLSKAAPAKFDQLRQLIEFVHLVTKD